MSYLAKIRAKSALQGTAKTDKTPKTEESASSVSFGSTSPGAFPEKKDTRDRDATTKQMLAAAVAGLSVTPDELHAELSADDMDAWRAGEIGPDNLRALAQAMQDGRDRQAGRTPAGYEAIATCKRCGPVWLFTDGTVESCPWCINRLAGWPIPRPGNVTCIDCRHFQRTEHPHLGRCGACMKPNNPTGRWWDTDRHGCARWLPKQSDQNAPR